MVCTSCGGKESPELVQLVHHYYSRINYKTRAELLAHYSKKSPTQFIQFDGFDDLQPDSVVTVDPDGHSLFSTKTWELMNSSRIRILIKPGASEESVKTLLRKMVDWVERSLPGYQQNLRTRLDSDSEDTPF
jgi:hypothetical protein